MIGEVDLVFPAIALNGLDRGDSNRVGANSHLFRDFGERLQAGNLIAKILDVDIFKAD